MATGLKTGPFTAEEDAVVVRAQAEFGNSWTRVAKLLPGRSDNSIKKRVVH